MAHRVIQRGHSVPFSSSYNRRHTRANVPTGNTTQKVRNKGQSITKNSPPSRELAMAEVEVSNKSVILKRFVTGLLTEDDMELVTGTVRLAVPPGSASLVVKSSGTSYQPEELRLTQRKSKPSLIWISRQI